MGKKIVRFALLPFALLVLSGCALLRPVGPKEMPMPEVHRGTTALEMTFLPGMPPEEVFEGAVFDITIDMANTGAYNIENGLYSFVFEEGYMRLERAKHTGVFDIKGKTIYDPVGGRQRLVFKARAELLPGQVERYPATIIFNACYAYKTEATVTVCIDTDVAGLKKDKVCTPKTISLSGGQGAPVAVTRIEQKMIPYDGEMVQPTFVIYISNQGGGHVVDTRMLGEACGARITEEFGREAFNKITRLTVSMIDQTLSCTPDKPVLSPFEDAKVVCTAPNPIGPERGTYTSPLSIEIDYGYANSITTTTTIIKPI